MHMEEKRTFMRENKTNEDQRSFDCYDTNDTNTNLGTGVENGGRFFGYLSLERTLTFPKVFT